MNKRPQLPRWVRIVIPGMAVLLWLVLGAIGGPYFGKISDVSSTDLATFLPKSAESTKVNEELEKFRSEKNLPLIVVFEDSGKLLSEAQLAQIDTVPDKLKNHEGVNGAVSQPVRSDDGKAAFVVVPLLSDGDFKEILPGIKDELTGAKLDTDYKLTGAAAFAHDLQGAFAGIDGTLLGVALAVVFVILLVVYRSILLPIIVLVVAISALGGAIVAVYHLAEAGIVELNGQVQGILFILVIGAATDYSLLYIARYKEELYRFASTWKATVAALKASYEPILAAGGTVAIGLMCLLFSDLASNKALGPVGGIGIGFSVLAALSFLPAALLLVGRFSFWPRVPRYEPGARDYETQHIFWRKVGHLVRRHPRRVWLGSIIVLLGASFGLMQLKAEGVSQSNLVLGYSEAREGQKLLDKHFAAGSGAPAYIMADQNKLNEVVKTLDADGRIDSVGALATTASPGTIPLGKSELEIRNKILQEVTAQREKQVGELKAGITSQMVGAPQFVINQAVQSAGAKIPGAESIAAEAYPFKGAEPKVADGRVALQATLKDAADSLEARRAIVDIRSQVKRVDPTAIVGGTTAIQYDTNQASLHDQKVLIPLILFAITIVLMLLLRSVVAPLVLLFTTVLSFGATLGISALLFNHLWNFPGADPSVIIFGFVFLVALGIDYNIFLMTRVREETLELGVNKGTIKGLVVTGGVITSAGVVLAATFAALYVIPILFLAQIAFIVAFGVLLDTILVRSLLVPSLTLELGSKMWWPSKKLAHLKRK